MVYRLLLFGVCAGLIGVPTAGFAEATSAHDEQGEAIGPLLAKKKRKKKRRRKNPEHKEDMDFGPLGINPADGDSGVGVHREHEGVDQPYFAEAAFSTNLAFLSQEVDGSDSDPKSLTNYSVDFMWLFILGSFEIGPDISYRSQATTTTTTTTDTSGASKVETGELTVTSFSVGGLAKWNFGDIDKDMLVFFAHGGIGYRQSEAKQEDFPATKTTGTVAKLGGGLNIFLDSNIAFNPRGEFYRETDEAKEDEDAIVTTTTGLRILVGFGVFL